jgi:MFS transporter, DHA2 family, multidrug resistance protein
MFMAILDVQVVATSLPSIQRALAISPDQTSWIQTAYLIAEVIAIPLTGFLMRVMTMRWLFVAALAMFTLASLGCASSASFEALVSWRIAQGFAGGLLIPAVFSAVFLLFPARLQNLATGLAGMLAVIAPTTGPIVGGWITETFSWHALFAINLVPGLVATIAAVFLLPRQRLQLKLLRQLDFVGLLLAAIALASLEIGLKEAPQRGWASLAVLTILGLSLAAFAGFVARSLRARHPMVELRTLADRNFSIGCGLSFTCGIGLFGSVYLMPVFLGYVRRHGAMEVGQIMLVTGLAQLVVTPLIVVLEQRIDARWLALFGFTGFAIGAAMSAMQTPQTDYDAMFWPQVVRGASVMFCLLPPTRLALAHLDAANIPDASGLFNLMRNLGGAIGLALIDTVIYGRAPIHAQEMKTQLIAGDRQVLAFLNIPWDAYVAHSKAPLDSQTEMAVRYMIETGATAKALNEAWALMAGLMLFAIIAALFARRAVRAPAGMTAAAQVPDAAAGVMVK